MKKIDFNKMLPNENSEEFEKAKKELPYQVLISYAEAINEKYKGKLKAFVTESSLLKNVSNSNEVIKENLVMALSFEAAIGRGYLYRLIEIEQLKNAVFPVKVKVFSNHTSVLGTYKEYESFYPAIIKFLESSIVKTIILNLLAQVELYNESRSQRFDWENEKPKE